MPPSDAPWTLAAAAGPPVAGLPNSYEDLTAFRHPPAGEEIAATTFLLEIWMDKPLASLLAAAIFAASVSAETDFCDSHEGISAWDFWVGSWNVVGTRDGQHLGTNRITRPAGQCVLLEDWSGLADARGSSINFYDPGRDVWRQVWADNAGYTVELEGQRVANAMILEGEFKSLSDGKSVAMRGTWTLLEDGSVRQVFEVKDKHGNWVSNWDARYVRIEEESR